MNKIITILILTVFCSCARDTVTEPDCTVIDDQTYKEARLIINESCSYSGCHLDGGATGNFDTYEGLKDYLENGGLNNFVSDVNSARMPPSYAAEGKKEISPLEILQLICWIDQGYPEE